VVRTKDEEEHRDGLQENRDTTLEAHHPQAARGGQAQHTWTHCGERDPRDNPENDGMLEEVETESVLESLETLRIYITL
jgi:hypothetical protein